MSLLPPGRFLLPGNTRHRRRCRSRRRCCRCRHPREGRVFHDGSVASRRTRTWCDRFTASFFAARPPDRAGRCLPALDSGPEAFRDIEAALAGIIESFSYGRGSHSQRLFRPRIDRILFVASKADHLHHLSHDRLEAVLRRAVSQAVARAEATGAEIDVVALAAVL